MAHWHFRQLHPNENSGANISADNFLNEEREGVEILVRETLQNPLDARHEDQLVRVRYNIVSVNRASSAFAKVLFSDESREHFLAGKLGGAGDTPEKIDFLVIEDFGTSGLEGDYLDSSVDGDTQNWNAFWFREGEGAKPSKSNGGAGQGKVTLYMASELRTVFALTKRASDGKQLLFGCCKFHQNYHLPGQKVRWAKEALWGATQANGELAVPVEDSKLIEAIQDELKLGRDGLAGTSFVVPLPVGITLNAIRDAVVNEFYFSIKRGKLLVEVGDLSVDQTTVTQISKTLSGNGRHARPFLDFLDATIAGHIAAGPTAIAKIAWSKESKLTEGAFSEDQLKALKTAFEKSEIVSVDFPIQVRKRDTLESSTGYFRVVLKQDLDAEQSHELFVRQDLSIDGEKRLKGSRRIQPALAVTLIDDPILSAFLAAAEEPTHRTWNAKRKKLTARYLAPEKVLNAVRNAALRLVELLTPPGRRDETALSLYFADPTAPPGLRKGGAGTIASPMAENHPPKKIPEPKPKPIELIPLKSGFKVRASDKASADKLPLRCVVEMAYATTFGDPFDQWDAAEFWLKDAKLFPVSMLGVDNLLRGGNEISFELKTLDAELTLTGFDTNRQLQIRVNYQESEDASNI